ncbi:hypothetical protein BDF19DRAFT_61513 [Syncephalis fuscata]|nr:hypothetical protein BDF19DRAFT_61513 [Syncephalis fuscata]
MSSGAQIYIITGANRGFGHAVAKALAERVNDPNLLHLILVGRNATGLQAVATELQTKATTYIVDSVDMSSMDLLDSNLERIFTTYKEIRAENSASFSRVALVNNAGALGDSWRTLAEHDWKMARAYYDANVIAFIALTSYFLKTVRADKDITRQMVNVSSLLAIQPTERWSLYGSTKAARNALTATAAIEEAEYGTKTLNYAPGPLDNDMHCEIRKTATASNQETLYSKQFSIEYMVDPMASATKLVNLITENTFKSGAHIDYFDI